MRKAGNRVRVTAQLIDASNGGHVWASRFDRDLTDIFAVQDELTQEIVAALKLKLTAGEQGSVGARARGQRRGLRILPARPGAGVGAHPQSEISRRAAWQPPPSRSIPAYSAAHALIAFTHVLDYVNAWSTDPEQLAADRAGARAAGGGDGRGTAQWSLRAGHGLHVEPGARPGAGGGATGPRRFRPTPSSSSC